MTDDLKPETPVVGGRGHKPTCDCRTCQRIRQMHNLGQAKETDKRRLGPRQVRRRAFVKAYADPLSPTFGNQGKSAESAHYAASRGNGLLKEPQVQNMVRAALERHGIDDDFLAIGLKEGLRAEETKLATFEGKFTDERRVPDFRARARFQEMTHRLRGDMPKEDVQNNSVILLQIPQASFTVGHAPDCTCPSCLDAYEKQCEIDRERLDGDSEARARQYRIDRDKE